MFVTIEKDEFGNKHRVIKCRNYSYEDVVFAKCVFKVRYPNQSEWSKERRFTDYIKPRSEVIVISSPVEEDIEYQCIDVDCTPVN